MTKTTIAWTDESWNFIKGKESAFHCVKVSPGCANCYAERLTMRWGGKPYTKGSDGVRFDLDKLREPLSWRKGRMVFVCSMTDLFFEDVPVEWIDLAFAVMAVTPYNIYQVLTKRCQRASDYFNDPGTVTRIADASRTFPISDERARVARNLLTSNLVWPLPNVWLIFSVEDQKRANERVPILARTNAFIRGLSVEPMIGAIDLDDALPDWQLSNNLDWVIIGGESGQKCRPMSLDWVYALTDQCVDARVAVFIKQLGGYPDKRDNPSDFPFDLRIRQFPEKGKQDADYQYKIMP